MRKYICSVAVFMMINTILFGQNTVFEKYYLNIDSSLRNQIRTIPGDTINITTLDESSNNKVHYHLLIKKPDAGIDYKMLIVKPDPSQNFSIIMINPETGKSYNYLSEELMRKLLIKPDNRK